MKKLIVMLAAAMPVAAMAMHMPSIFTPTATIDLKGEVTPKCVASTHGREDLKLGLFEQRRRGQKVTALAVYCNVREGAKIKFESDNEGKLVNGDDSIPYNARWNGMDILDDYGTDGKLMTSWGHGEQWWFAQPVVVKPMVNGLEYAGIYTDTIHVTVYPN